MSEEVITVVIADDHPLHRAGARSALESGGMAVLAEAMDADSAVDAVRHHRPTVCLLDIHMPGNGIVAAARIGQEIPEVAVVMLTVSRNDEDLFGALRVGASGYLLKDTDPERLPEALRGVLRGEAALPRTLVARLIDEFRGPTKRRKAHIAGRRGVELTSREWEVLDLMGEGLSTNQIAERLFVGAVTVRTHVASILKKLRVNSRNEAVALLKQSPPSST